MEEQRKLQIWKCLHRFSLLIGALTIVLPLVFWSKIPERIPTHYNAAGVVDNWSDKTTLILLFFVIAMLMGMMSIAVYVVKANMNSNYSSSVEKNEMSMAYPVVICMNFVVQCMFAYMTLCSVTSRSLGSLFLPVVIIATFAPLFYFLVKRAKRPGQKSYKVSEKEERGIVYRSKVDWWIGLLLGGCCIWMFYLVVEPIVRKGQVEWFVVITAFITVGIVLPLFAIRYVMYSDHILVSCSIYGKERIRYQDIVGVKASRNPLSSAALSIDRLQIDYVEDGIQRMMLISPVKRKTFLEELEKRRNAAK